MPSIRLITLDLDDTLWPCMPVIQAAEEALYAWLESRAPRLTQAEDIASMRQHRHEIMERRPEIAHDLGMVRRLSLVELLDRHGHDAGIVDAALALFLENRCRVEPYADVLPSLQSLSRRYALVSVTNGNSNVEVTPLKGLFQHSISAAEAGAAKPHPAMFERALALTDCRPDQCLHVGDDPWLDVEAARQAGLSAAWINRMGKTWPKELAEPAVTITSMDELIAWLEESDNGL
ncbi:HAD family hydrolase [Thiorhodococcus mannitoliphagus]|uniref:HAD family hydrolase n=1 Tax=Thiorhodococcus mannitoliphagus TaxID=329406 RepID=A0A6P1DSU7_9GAMM|nr:HAD family hydrolase [Thiorhodococcus mannitoliphagus]